VAIVGRPSGAVYVGLPVGAASCGLIERALERAEYRGLADLILGRQRRHGLAGGIALGDLALLADVESHWVRRAGKHLPDPRALSNFDACYQHGGQDQRENHDHPILERPAEKRDGLYQPVFHFYFLPPLGRGMLSRLTYTRLTIADGVHSPAAGPSAGQDRRGVYAGRAKAPPQVRAGLKV
jgi:hypothetical protein